jgi:hypothetical protein
MTANDSDGRKPARDLPSQASGTRDDALRRAVRLTVVQELADEMAHDLNNVLTVITGSLQLFLMQQGGETATHQHVRNAIEAAQRGAQMTGNLLAYASPQVVDIQPFDLVEVVHAVAPLLRETLGPSAALNIVPPSTVAQTAATQQSPAPLTVVADRRFIESALLALGSIAAGSMVAIKTPPAERSAVQMSLHFERLSGGEAAVKSGALRAGCDVVELRVQCVANGLSCDVVRQTLTPAFGVTPANRQALDLSAAYASIRQCDGDVGVSPLSDGSDRDGFVVSILIPVGAT